MAHYAILDDKNNVVDIFNGIDETELIEGISPEEWYSNFHQKTCKRTSINTRRGEHILGGVPFRKNYAFIGGTYSETTDSFINPKPDSYTDVDGKNFIYVFNEEVSDWDPVQE
jgi:hypothetical protein